MNTETLSQVNPERMFIMTNKASSNEPSLKRTRKDPVWKKLNAVKNQRVDILDRDLWARSRGLISSEEMAKNLLNYLRKIVKKIISKVENNDYGE